MPKADDQQHDAQRQQQVDARHVDLPRLRLRRVQDLEARQQVELHGLARQRIGARNHRLAGDDGGTVASTTIGIRPSPAASGRTDDRRTAMRQHKCALPEIVQQKARKDHSQPGQHDRLPAEMAEIDIKRLGAGDGQKDSADGDESHFGLVHQESSIARMD